MMSRIVLAIAFATVSLAGGPALAVRCLDDPADQAQIATVRGAVDAACDCFSFDSRGLYLRCVVGIVNDQVAASQMRRECRGEVKRIYSKSICATRPSTRGLAVPCLSHASSGRLSCAIKPSGACNRNSAALTQRRCWAHRTCLDAADTNDDGRIGTPGDSGMCAPRSFTDNGDGTISDDELGLMWEKKSDDDSLNDKDLRYPLAGICSGDGMTLCAREADCALAGGTCDNVLSPGSITAFEWLDQLNAAAFGGYSDWRLPTIRDLGALRDGVQGIAGAFSNGCAPGCTVTGCSCTSTYTYYWSMSESTIYPDFSWAMYFGSDPVLAGVANDGHVRAVRGGP